MDGFVEDNSKPRCSACNRFLSRDTVFEDPDGNDDVMSYGTCSDDGIVIINWTEIAASKLDVEAHTEDHPQYTTESVASVE